MAMTRAQRKKRRRQQARRAGGGWRDRIDAYLAQHGHALLSSLGRMLRTPFTAGLTILVMAISLALASGFYLLIENVHQLAGSLEASNQLSLYLKVDVNEKRAAELVQKLRQDPALERVQLITAQQGLEEFRRYSGFGEALNALENNPLPIVIQILPKHSLEDPAALVALQQTWQKWPEVDFVQLDMVWMQRLQSIMALAKRGVLMLALLLGVGVVFITGNTIRLELQNRREEVIICKLIGATHGFILKPFLYSGFWYGLLSGVLAWILTGISLLVLNDPVERLAKLYQTAWSLSFFNLFETLALWGGAALLGMLGAWVVVTHQLQQLRPE